MGTVALLLNKQAFDLSVDPFRCFLPFRVLFLSFNVRVAFLNGLISFSILDILDTHLRRDLL